MINSIHLIEYDGDYLKSMNTKLLSKIIYYHFLELAQYPLLEHSIQSIRKTFENDNAVLFILLENNKIISYLLGYSLQLDDGRKVMFISYIYVAKSHRNKGIGKFMMDHIEQKALDLKLDGILLICDTEDQKVLNFYMTRNYMHDIILRRYDRYDVMFRAL